MPQTQRVHWWKELSKTIKAQIIIVSSLAVILAVVIVIVIMQLNRPPVPEAIENITAEDVVQENSHYLDQVGEDVPTLVEFLDFECEACGAVYPITEEIREQYDGQINYVIRYFPLPGHYNSMNAAVAVEAAAQQGKFEEMYRMMFETQKEWGEGQTSEADRFRGYAEDLGLDMVAYDEAIIAPETQARVEEDFNAGTALGVSGTPTFFLDGQELELMMSTDLTDAIDQALANL